MRPQVGMEPRSRYDNFFNNPCDLDLTDRYDLHVWSVDLETARHIVTPWVIFVPNLKQKFQIGTERQSGHDNNFDGIM